MIKERDESIEFINEESPYKEKAVEVDRTTMSVPEMRRMQMPTAIQRMTHTVRYF